MLPGFNVVEDDVGDTGTTWLGVSDTGGNNVALDGDDFDTLSLSDDLVIHTLIVSTGFILRNSGTDNSAPVKSLMAEIEWTQQHASTIKHSI